MPPSTGALTKWFMSGGIHWNKKISKNAKFGLTNSLYNIILQPSKAYSEQKINGKEAAVNAGNWDRRQCLR